jgi:hypothetical protein
MLRHRHAHGTARGYVRRVVVFVCVLLLAGCYEVTGDQNGGVIAGVGGAPNKSLDSYLPQSLKDYLGLNVKTDAEVLQIAHAHCLRYGKRARITNILSSKTIFECLQ